MGLFTAAVYVPYPDLSGGVCWVSVVPNSGWDRRRRHIRAEPEMDGLLCDLLWADPSDDPGVTNIESLSDQVMRLCILKIPVSLFCILAIFLSCCTN